MAIFRLIVIYRKWTMLRSGFSLNCYETKLKTNRFKFLFLIYLALINVP